MRDDADNGLPAVPGRAGCGEAGGYERARLERSVGVMKRQR